MDKIKKNWYFILITFIFILAIVLRVKTYLLVRPLWHDECSLAANIMTRDILGYFQALDYSQKAPVLFMMFTKMVTNIFGFSVLTLRFIPFLCGILSIWVFYLLSKQLLANKFAITVANLLFAINYELIYFSQEFKQYSLDVLLVMASILFFSKLDLSQLSYKKCIWYSLGSLLLILTSFPCSFVVGAYIVFNFFNKQNLKKNLLCSLPIIVFSLIYYFLFLHNVQRKEVLNYSEYWDLGFLKFNINSIVMCIKENFNFLFSPNNFVWLGLGLFIIGLASSLKASTKMTKIILLSFFFVVLASVFKIYPIWQRVSLYLLPIIILFMVKPLEVINKNRKALSLVIVIGLVVCFSKYDFNYINGFFKPDVFTRSEAISTFPLLVKKYEDTDIIVINSSTEADFKCYSTLYRFKPKTCILAIMKQYDKKYYYDFMNSLPRGYTYWFIFGWESPISSHLENYIKDFHLKLKERYENNGSKLYKVSM